MKKIFILVLLLMTLYLTGCEKKEVKGEKKKAETKELVCKKTTSLDDFTVYVTIDYKYKNNKLYESSDHYIIYDVVKGNAKEDDWESDDYSRYIYSLGDGNAAYVDGKPDAKINIKTNQLHKYGYELRAYIDVNNDITKMEEYETIEKTKELYYDNIVWTCEEKTEGTKEKEEKSTDKKKKSKDNQETLTCSKISVSSNGLVKDNVDTYVYENGVLKSGVMTEKRNTTKFIEYLTREESTKLLEESKKKDTKCSLSYMDIKIFKGGIKDCSNEWDGYFYNLTYHVDVDKLKNREDFKDIKKLKDFYEKAIFKCDIN